MHDASKNQAAAQRVHGFRFSPARISKGSPSRRISDREIFYHPALDFRGRYLVIRESMRQRPGNVLFAIIQPEKSGLNMKPGKTPGFQSMISIKFKEDL
jgi:hypothetical protein